jgi:glycosyltransferase involved in cell wall biosynthesis
MRSAVTVLIPTHNRREHVLMAIESVRLQTRQPEEIIVVADGCTDDTVEAVRALDDERIVVLDLPKGPGNGWIHRNEALRMAKGEVVANLADDDLWMPEHLEHTVELIEAGVAELVQANSCRVFPDGGLELQGTDWRVPEYRRRYFEEIENRTPSSAVVHKPRAALDAGGWRTVKSHGDWNLWTRMMESGVRTAATMEPTALIFEAWRADAPHRERDREPQAREFLARLRDPLEVARLKAEISRVGLQFEADTRHELYRRNDQHAALHERFGAALAELERLRERDATLKRIENGGWWRLRRRLEPLKRAADAARLTPASRR